MEKITKRQNIQNLLAMDEVQANADAVAYLTNELALLDKKNARRKTELTETQKENITIKSEILNLLVDKLTEMSCSAIAKEFGLSTQRVTPILTKLVDEGVVSKTKVKGVNLYKAI